MKVVRSVVLGLSVVLLALATYSGMLMNYLLIFLIVSAAIMLVTSIAAIVKKQLPWDSLRQQLSGYYLCQRLLRNATWIISGWCVYIAVIPVQFTPDDYLGTTIMLWGSVAVLCVLDWMPRMQTGSALNITLSMFLVFLVYQLALVYYPSDISDSVELSPPFQGEWYVFHGGNSPLMNHHHFAGSQKYAMDIILPADGKLPLQQVTDLKQYATFGQPLYSPVGGVVVAVEDSLADQQIGETDITNPAGNHIVIKTKANRFLLLAHLQINSVQVAVGDTVKPGQEIGNVGNSGNTSQPHLHIQAMTRSDLFDPESKPIPVAFKIGNEAARHFRRNDILRGMSSG